MATVEERILEVKARRPKLKFIKVDKNNTLYFADYTCQRCGGRGGADQWTYTGYTCYECGGSGISDKPDILKYYTPEYQAKLDAMAEKRAEKRHNELLATVDTRRAEAVKNTFGKEGDEYVVYAVIGNTYPIRFALKDLGCRFDVVLGWYSKTDLKDYPTVRLTFDEIADWDDEVSAHWSFKGCRELKAVIAAKTPKDDAPTSEYVGKVGDEITFTGTPTCVYSCDDMYGNTRHFYKFVVDGNTIMWKTTSWLDETIAVTLKGKVKGIDEYRGEKQTEVTRCKLVV